jgi:hypothetical protein
MESTPSSTPYHNKEFEDFIESDYEKSIPENESRTYEFIVGKEKLVEKPDFTGRLTKKAQFVVINQNDPAKKEKKFELSKMHISRIYEQFTKGFKVLEISRIGKGKETRYLVKPIR